jgi:hypothetical protein
MAADLRGGEQDRRLRAIGAQPAAAETNRDGNRPHRRAAHPADPTAMAANGIGPGPTPAEPSTTPADRVGAGGTI